MRETRLFISAGEASGDAYGAALLAELRKMDWEGEVQAVGGVRIAAQKAKLVANSATWGAISIVQSLATFPRIVGGYYRAKRALRTGKPGLFVPIDFGYVNIRLTRHAKNHGWKVLYFVPPGSWRRDRQGGDLPSLTDAIVTPFPWSADLLVAAGAKAYFFGHPIKQLLRGREVPAQRTRLAVLPGSRSHELANNLPVIAAALKGLDYEVEFALAPSTDESAFRSKWRGLGFPDPIITVGDTGAVLRRARAGLVCSGTATLEAALCRTPMAVVYQISKAMRTEAKMVRFKVPEFVSLPNILLQKRAIPEHIDDVDPNALRSDIVNLMQDGPERAAQLAAFDELDTLLGPDDAITQTARLALSLVPGS